MKHFNEFLAEAFVASPRQRELYASLLRQGSSLFAKILFQVIQMEEKENTAGEGSVSGVQQVEAASGGP